MMLRPLVMLSLLLCLNLPVAAYDDEIYPIFESDSLKQGREVWLQNCTTCHGSGMYGAPVPDDPEDWADSAAKGRDVLYIHAIEGFSGPQGNAMPARGGNRDLSDQQVKHAVDYMMQLAEHYRQLE